MGIIILSAYLAGIVYWIIGTRKILKNESKDIWNFIGYLIGICIWPLFLIIGFIMVIINSIKDGA